jgi:transcriptional regulator with XRE-family HTH domain
MNVGDRLRTSRQEKGLTQDEIEKRARVFRKYVSRVENEHKALSVETREKCARALKGSMYQLFYEGDEAARFSNG